MDQPLVSVVIPTYKRSEMLHRAVDSVLNQTYPNIQVIVVDDNNPDTEWRAATTEKMRIYEHDARVKYVCHEHNRNGSAARNTGIRSADGEIIAFLDDDDWFHPEKVSLQVEYLLAHPQYRAVYCGWDRDGRKILPNLEGDLSFELLSGRNIIITNTIMMWRADALACGGWDERLKRHQEAGFLLRYFACGGKIGVVSRILTEFDVSDRSNAATNSEAFELYQLAYLDYYKDRIEACEAQRKGAGKDIYSYRYRGILLSHIKGRNYGAALRIYGQMLQWMPVKFNIDLFSYCIHRGKP